MSKGIDKILGEWLRTWKKENLSEDVCKLISQANFDLYYGPINDGAVGDPAADDEELAKYPGFVSACKTIRKAIDDLPSTLYINSDTEEVIEREPACEEFDCDWWMIEKAQILKALVGKELVTYV